VLFNDDIIANRETQPQCLHRAAWSLLALAVRAFGLVPDVLTECPVLPKADTLGDL
jgi:hypothetical protein